MSETLRMSAAAQERGGVVYELSGVEHFFGDRQALFCPGLTVEQGRIVGIGGQNGAGKSTLLLIMAFLLAPMRGVVRFLGRPGVSGDVALRRQVVLLPQNPALLTRRVRDNVLAGLKLRGRPEKDEAERALDLVGLDPKLYLKRWWWELSGGEAHRVALAARLALGERVLLLDEPTANLDPQSCEMIRRALLGARERLGMTVVIVSHDREWLTRACDDVYRLEPGRGVRREEEYPCVR